MHYYVALNVVHSTLCRLFIYWYYFDLCTAITLFKITILWQVYSLLHNICTLSLSCM